MARVNVHVWHTPKGRIVAVGRPAGKGRASFVPLPSENQSVLEIEVEERDLPNLPQTHAVDPQKRLVKRRRDETREKPSGHR